MSREARRLRLVSELRRDPGRYFSERPERIMLPRRLIRLCECADCCAFDPARAERRARRLATLRAHFDLYVPDRGVAVFDPVREPGTANPDPRHPRRRGTRAAEVTP